MLFFLLSLLFIQVNSSCKELIEVSNKKNLIFTFTNKVNNHFPKDYEYCIKISNKAAAVFMNNAIASLSITSGLGASKSNIKIKKKKSLGYFFLPTEQENIINFKIKSSKNPFSVSFVSFPDDCDVKMVSNFPEKLISPKDYSYYSSDNIKKSKKHICYFSGFPFETQFQYNEEIEKKYSFKFTLAQNIGVSTIKKV